MCPIYRHCVWRLAFPRTRSRPPRPCPPLRPRSWRCSPAALPRARVRPWRHTSALPCAPRARRDASVVGALSCSPTRLHQTSAKGGRRLRWEVAGGGAAVACGAAGADAARGDLPMPANCCVSPARAGGELISSSHVVLRDGLVEIGLHLCRKPSQCAQPRRSPCRR